MDAPPSSSVSPKTLQQPGDHIRGSIIVAKLGATPAQSTTDPSLASRAILRHEERPLELP
ncbi:hypothetical protein GRAN_0215 [Granulicella sibirica]|uniref:Uncharacterized protein n=1 Tax=Granulicella sibirica TaxID=2479048 RepID=A0A4Q0T023_9BACT|nr:hypothetical protein GRAN_0215 [Granulicella sibirica]